MTVSSVQMNVSPLLGIEEPSLLLEGLNQRIAYLEHRLQIGCFATEGLMANSAAFLEVLRRERDELMSVLAEVTRFRLPFPLVVATPEDKR